MSLYPSLEDMKIDQLSRAQGQIYLTNTPQNPQNGQSPTSVQNPTPGYPSLGDYMGLELTESVISQNMPEYLSLAITGTVRLEKILIKLK